MTRGQLYIISGPSGSGKDTLIRTLMAADPELRLSISTTTRQPRDEYDYEKYHFVAVEEFSHLITGNLLLEYNEYLGSFYGTPIEPLEKWLGEGRDVILEIDVNGAEKVRKKIDDLICIFVLPPSMETLKERLFGRKTEDCETASQRLAAAISEIEHAVDYDYIIVNDNLSEAAKNLQSVFTANRLKIRNMKNKIRDVLETRD